MLPSEDQVPLQRWGSDPWLMDIALRMAAFGLGTTAPNPSVGAVIFRPDLNQIVGRGVTQPGGRPHAEPEAIMAAGPLAKGATMAVTLEPCSHHGRSPPCVDAILSAGISKVIYAAVDPDPRVAGRGLSILRDGGVEVVAASPVQGALARWVTRGHILRVTERRPLVQVKIAVDANGQVAAGGSGRPTWVTGPLARRQGHMMRAIADAICVGTGTVIADDPELTCRLPGLSHRSPLRVVIGNRRVPGTAKLASRGAMPPVWQYHAQEASQPSDAPMAPTSVLRRNTTCVGDRVWLPAVLEDLASQGVTRLLVEGGPMLWAAFANARLVDEVVIFQARQTVNTAIGEETSRVVLNRYCPLPGAEFIEARAIGSDVRTVFRAREAVGWRVADGLNGAGTRSD